MSLQDTETVVVRLQSEWKYPRKGAELVAAKLANLTPPLNETAARWWDAGVPITDEYHGHTVSSLKTTQGMNDIAAILTLDFLIRDPQKALEQIARGQK